MNKTYFCIGMLLALWATPFTLNAVETTDYHQAWAWLIFNCLYRG